jgi:tetraacyldisaccharide 4'-kinase
MQPLSWLYGGLAAIRSAIARAPRPLPVPVLVVGNYTAGGGGKTPTVIALVQALKTAGHRPGVISRGHGRNSEKALAVGLDSPASAVGDEPLLIHRRTGAPVWVARDRPSVAQRLCQQHPEVDVLISDDGLQHAALTRQAAVVVFDERGDGNGLMLPAGPLRERLPAQLPANVRVLYTTGRASTRLPGALATRQIDLAWPLAAWRVGDASAAVPLIELSKRNPQALCAAAGLAAPEKFFSMLEDAGLCIGRLPLPDHFDFSTLPWPDDASDLLVTEKDAVKIDPQRLGSTRVWVVPLDLVLPLNFVSEIIAMLRLPPVPSPSVTTQATTQASTATSTPP